MTYAFGTEAAESTPETSRWYKLTPEVISWLRAVYPQDRGVNEMISRVTSGPVYMGVSASGDELYYMTATTTGVMGGRYKAPAASDAPVMTYDRVLAVFAPARGGSDTKSAFPAPGERPLQRSAAQPAQSSRAGLYVGLGLVGLLAVGGVAYAMTRKPVTLTANGRRRRRLRKNSSLGPTRDRLATRAREAFARGDSAAAARALAELREVDLSLMPRAVQKNASYAIPERKAYPITTALDAYHAAQRLKQGRVKSATEAQRIISAIKRQHPGVWHKYLAGYPVAKIIASKRKGIIARARS